MITTPMPLATTLSLVLSLQPQGDVQEPAPDIAWQRSLADALAVQQSTGLPLLIAVNMNGEVFNDRFRTATYKRADFIESTRGYVCVVASPDRHNERDYDSLGNRIECPAFPGCTCGEHIAIEPKLFARYFNGNRNAPRHVGVSPAGKILFDRFLDRRMRTAIDAIAEHRGEPVEYPVPDGVELFERRDAASRRALEDEYRRAQRRSTSGEATVFLVGLASKAENEPFDLLRLALHEDGGVAFHTACDALAATATPDALADLEHALARNDHPEAKAILLAAIERLAKTDERSARLHAHLTEQAEPAGGPWRNEWREPEYEIWKREAIEAELDGCEKLLRATPHDHEARLRLAIAQLAFAQVLITTGGKGVEFWLEDARSSARRIPENDLHAEAQAVIAAAAWLRNDPDATHQAAIVAIVGKRSDRQANAWLATRLFETIVQTDTTAAYAKTSDPRVVMQPEVARVHAALQLLVQSRWVTEQPMLTGIGLLEYAGLRNEARDLLFAAVRRFQTSNAVHERWRDRVMLDFGPEQMHALSRLLAAEASDKATGEWYAGYAALVVAERHVRDVRPELTLAAYTDSIDRFTVSVETNPGYADSANHFAVLALAGRAWAHYEAGDDQKAVADLVRAAALRDTSLDSKDGLQRTPRGIAGKVKQALEATGKTELAAPLGRIAR